MGANKRKPKIQVSQYMERLNNSLVSIQLFGLSSNTLFRNGRIVPRIIQKNIQVNILYYLKLKVQQKLFNIFYDTIGSINNVWAIFKYTRNAAFTCVQIILT